ncbi:MAG: hypothetical protein ACK5LT_03420 [Lachnospirales bacterium]
MIKYEINEFIDLIEEELRVYEHLSEDEIDDWKHIFLQLVDENKVSKQNLAKEGGIFYFKIEDEMEIFSIVDDYSFAIENNSLKDYWDSFY